MSVISTLRTLNNIQSVEEALRAKDCTSQLMREAIREWIRLYLQDGVPPDQNDCQRLPVLIVSKLAKTVFSEYAAAYDGGHPQIDALLERIDAVKQQAMQWALVGGECFIKPILTAGGLDLAVVRRDCFVPFGRDARGRITDLGMLQTDTVDGAYYTLLERRTLLDGGDLRIESRLYRSHECSTLGARVPLAALPQYAMLGDEITLPAIGSLGMAPLRTPQLNTVDGSSDAVAIYAPAVGLIREINRNERQLSTEFENGASRIFVSEDLLDEDRNGKRRFSASLFTGLDEGPENAGVTIFSPQLREQSYLNRKQEYLRNIESLIGLKRGILSEVEAAERTATEITSSQGDYNLTITDFQRAFEATVRELLPTCEAIGRVYRLWSGAPFDQDKFSISWGDGVLFNRDRTWQELKDMVADGMLKPELALAWYFDLPKDTPEDLVRIRENYMPEGGELI